jgi:hypothetical protein
MAFCIIAASRELFLVPLHLLHVYGVGHGLAFGHGRLREVLAGAELLEHACFFVFAFKFLEGPFDVFALLDRHNDHNRSFFIVFFEVFLSFVAVIRL